MGGINGEADVFKNGNYLDFHIVIDFKICKSYSNLVENETVRENIFGMIFDEYNLTKEIILSFC